MTASRRIAAKLIISAKNVIFLVLYFLSRLSRRQEKISILLYHSIDQNSAHYNVNPEQFEMQMEYLRTNCDVVSLDTVLDFIKGGKDLPKRPVVITFDDGYYSVYQNAYPVLKKCRFPAAVFITTGYVQKQMTLDRIQLRMLGWNEIKEMSNNGVTIGAHTITHPNLEQVDLETAKKEILGSKEEIEENIGKGVRYFASPYGKENEEIVELVKLMGFDYALGPLSSNRFIRKGANHSMLNRIEIDSSVALWMFKAKLTKAVDWYRKFEQNASKIASRFSFLAEVDLIYNMRAVRLQKDRKLSVKDSSPNAVEKMNAIKITVGVCVKNKERTIKSSIDSIFKQKFPRDLMQIIVVDGCSTDRTLPIIRNVTSAMNMSVEIFSDKSKGLGAARQMVVDNAKGDYIIFVDGDVELQEDFVQKQVDFMEKNPKVATAVGRYMCKEGNLLSTVWCLFNSVSSSLGNDATIYRSEVLRQVGGFDENIRGAAEDKDVVLRIHKKGWAFSANEKAGFYHNCRQSFKEFWKEQAWFGSGDHYLFHKHGSIDSTPLWRRIPAGYFRYGLRLAAKSYRLANRKISFLMPSLMVLGNIAWWFGFVKAHLNGYGHETN
jgi:peptidoglycan/xylan/chitin deacetylase (PgdA/CDA1 family)/glycosyltransferase involved in cell wall biosynthesis